LASCWGVILADVHAVIRDDVFNELDISTSTSAKDKASGKSHVAQHAYAAASGKYVPTTMPAFGDFWRTSLPDMTIRLGDVAKLGEWIVRQSEELRKALSERSVLLPVQVSAGAFSEKIPASFGYICGQYEADLVGHNGSVFGQTVALRMDPARNIVIVAGVNAWAPAARDGAVELARQLLADGGVTDTAAAGSETATSFSFEQFASGLSPEDLVGTYVGSLYGQVTVDLGKDGVVLRVGSIPSRQVSIPIERRADGTYQFNTPLPVSGAFVRHPSDGSPVCYLGVHAYRRISSTASP
jgi:hypothetical protein